MQTIIALLVIVLVFVVPRSLLGLLHLWLRLGHEEREDARLRRLAMRQYQLAQQRRDDKLTMV